MSVAFKCGHKGEKRRYVAGSERDGTTVIERVDLCDNCVRGVNDNEQDGRKVADTASAAALLLEKSQHAGIIPAKAAHLFAIKNHLSSINSKVMQIEDMVGSQALHQPLMVRALVEQLYHAVSSLAAAVTKVVPWSGGPG